ncbi:hypothetical protein ACFL01_01260 [Planctomycetota bacterium]
MIVMNDLGRFIAVAKGETPDYVPIFGFPGAPGMAGGCMRTTHDRLVSQGMPARVGGVYEHKKRRDVESWHRYWGTTGPIHPGFGVEFGTKGFKSTTRVEGEHEIVESESGAITRQVIDNDVTYSMPEFIRYPVRDRESWEFYEERMTPRTKLPPDEIEENCRALDDRTMPLEIPAGSSYGFLRGLMGPEAVSITIFEDPELLHDMMTWQSERIRTSAFPLIERLKPEIVAVGEDLCYNHGMLLSPKHFDEFCGSYYREVCGCARANGAAVIAIDTDGNAMEFTGIAASYGVNAIYPYEVKGGNDLFELRKRHPEFVFFGWLEKEIVNEGNEHLIEPEIMNKVPKLLEKGRYFPNGDHGIQPMVTFDGLRKFMTILHETCDNPEGEFERV